MFIANLSVDYDFLKTYGMELLAGRTFGKEFGTDPAEAFIVNETAVRAFKWESPEKALGKKIVREGKEGKVVGVIRDFHFSSLTTPVAAMVVEMSPNQYNTLSVKFENENIQSTLDNIEMDWNRMFPEKTFQFTFLDEQLDSQYQSFQNFGIIIQTFACIAILISCLGVYGLVLFVVKRKVKEIGVRKVLGASMGSILRLIYSDFAWLLAIGFIVAIPVSYYFMSQWLENFTYRTSIDLVTYAISFLLVIFIVSLTIAYQALQASLANPVKSLRSE
jgi:putative ABC transport system permease protein